MKSRGEIGVRSFFPVVRVEYFVGPVPGEVVPVTVDNETAILSRVIDPDQPHLPAGLARRILRWEFPDADRRRMHELLEKAKARKLTRRERVEAENYERVGHFLSILKSQARTSLRARNSS
jgi:hypothetical protein